MNCILTQVEFLLTPKIPAKFQEVEFAPKYRIWVEKIKQVSQTLDGADLLKRAMNAVCRGEDKYTFTIEPPPPLIQAPKLVIELDHDEVQAPNTTALAKERSSLNLYDTDPKVIILEHSSSLQHSSANLNNLDATLHDFKVVLRPEA